MCVCVFRVRARVCVSCVCVCVCVCVSCVVLWHQVYIIARSSRICSLLARSSHVRAHVRARTRTRARARARADARRDAALRWIVAPSDARLLVDRQGCCEDTPVALAA